eukprot:5985660-Pleurochrysis_carterae.AAC.1
MSGERGHVASVRVRAVRIRGSSGVGIGGGTLLGGVNARLSRLALGVCVEQRRRVELQEGGDAAKRGGVLVEQLL